MPRSQLRTSAPRASARVRNVPAPRKPRTAKQARREHRGGEWGRGVAERLWALKGAAGVRAFAERVGVAPSLVSSYLNGGRLPTAERLQRIAERTGVSLDWLLLGEGGAAPRFRGQDRNQAELEADVAAYVARAASPLLVKAFVDPAVQRVEVDGALVLRRAVETELTEAERWLAAAYAHVLEIGKRSAAGVIVGMLARAATTGEGDLAHAVESARMYVAARDDDACPTWPARTGAVRLAAWEDNIRPTLEHVAVPGGLSDMRATFGRMAGLISRPPESTPVSAR